MVMIIARTLCGLKRSGDLWRAKLAETFMSLGCKSSEADADVWMNWDFKPKEDMDVLNMIYQLNE